MSIDYLVARIECLSELVADATAVAEEGHFDPSRWQQDHPERLQRYADKVAAIARDETSGLVRLAAEHQLDRTDEDIVLIALAAAIDQSFARSMATLQRTLMAGAPTIDVIASVLSTDLPSRLAILRRFGADRVLVEAGLIRTARGRSEDFGAQQVRVTTRIQRLLLGGDAPDPAGGGFGRLIEPKATLDELLVPDEDRAALVAFAHGAGKLEAFGARILLIVGDSGTGKTMAAHAVAAESGSRILVADTAALLTRSNDQVQALTELLADAELADAVVLLDDSELLFANRLQGNRVLQSLLTLLDETDRTVIMATQLEAVLDPSFHRRVLLRVGMTVPVPSLREAIWRRALPADLVDDDADIKFLSEKYDFSGGQIEVAAAFATALAHAAAANGTDGTKIGDLELERAAEAQMRHHLEQLAIKTITHLRLDDIVLPPDLMAVIRSIIAAVRNRRRIFEEWGFNERITTGRGLTMLFRGDSGTGKTLTAEILAGELAMPLYRVAIPRIVSKYIGETEQNLEKAFKEAEVAGAILLFDEADAIFTKRVEVGSATDRYSNMEVNLLLQELERFEGIVILTTNLDAAIDDAFERRLNYKLDFPFPTSDLRCRIWARHLPDKAPIDLEDGELEYLAEQFELSGGSIKNVVVRAAYAAAEAGSNIDVERLEEASIQEYRELGKLVRG